MEISKARLIAFYLPQYYPIPENDEWWGKGFTEWTNVANAKPLFRGHYQPHIPADLGFYDLRVPEVRQAQADMAREYGIEGFCYWHYWFAGKKLLDRPFNEVLSSGKPDFPFCLAWANATWSGVWYGDADRILIKQTYTGREDNERHFYEVLPAFKDPRYITVEGKPLFVIFKSANLPDPQSFINYWQELALMNGLKGIYFLGLQSSDWDYKQCGFDGEILDTFGYLLSRLNHEDCDSVTFRIFYKLTKRNLYSIIRRIQKRPKIYSYKNAIYIGLPEINPGLDQYPVILPNWDNTPRSNQRGLVFQGSTPELFRVQLLKAISQISHRPAEKQIIFIKSWNEWAEGNYLEPDQKFGTAYLQVIKETLR
jgi:hypothetical protein